MELKAVLQLLLLLSDTVGKKSEPPIGHKPFTLPVCTHRKKNNVMLPNGPLFHGDSFHSHDFQLHGYPHYSRELFERRGFISDRMGETFNLDKKVFQMEPGRNLHGPNLFNVKVFQMEPGRNLHGPNLFNVKVNGKDSVEEINRSRTLYHGLIHSRTSDLNVKLTLPPLPQHTSLLGLKIPVYKEVEDEGFNESMCSEVSLSTADDNDESINIWEAALTHQLHNKYTWERIGSFPKPTERPYLSEAGPDALDQLYLLRNYALTLVEPNIQMQNQIEVTQSDLVKDGLNILLAIPSKTFQFERETTLFYVNQNIHYNGTSPEMLVDSLASLADAGTYYWQLSEFAKQRSLDSMYTGGLTLQAFCSGIQAFLHFYRSRVLTVPWNSRSTVSMVRHAFREFITQLKYLWMFCMCDRRKFGRPGDPGDPLPTGIQLLSYIYQQALDCSKSHNYKIMLTLLRSSCRPYLMFIQDWIFNGICRDGYGEFMITANDNYLQYRDKYYWTHGFVMNTEDTGTSVPMFLQELANGMYVCGKTLNLMKLCCPAHFLCNNHVPIPRLSLTYSLEELERIDKETQLYIERMHNIVRHNTVSKEQKEARLEKAKEDLLIQARHTVVDDLNRIRGQMKQVNDAVAKKKQNELEELKEQMQRDLVRRAMEVEEEKELDRLYVEKQDRIEKGIADIEDELERKAQEEIIEYYAKLTEDAIHREQHALWQIQRHKLNEKRTQFFQQDEKTLKEELLRVYENMSISSKQTESTEPAMSSESLMPLSSTEDVSTNESDVQTVVEIMPLMVDDTNTGGRNSSTYNNDSPGTSGESQKQDDATAETSGEINKKGDLTAALSDEQDDLARTSGVTYKQEDIKPVSSVLTDELLDQQPGQMDLLDTSLHDFLPKQIEEVFHQPDDDFDDILIEIGSELPSKDLGEIKSMQNTRKTEVKMSSELPNKEIGTNLVHLPPASNQGCQSTIEEILYSMRGKTDLPQRGDYGHSSDCTLTVNLGDVDVKLFEQRTHIYGHSSDSTIGDLINAKEDVCEPVKHKQRSKWGHPSSTSDIRLGLIENSCEGEVPAPQKATGGDNGVESVKSIDDIKLISAKPFGHSAQSTIQNILYSQQETAKLPCGQTLEVNQEVASVSIPARGIYGHSSDSSIQNVLYQGTDEVERKKMISGQVYRGRGLKVVGHPSDSSAGKIIYGDRHVQANVKALEGTEDEGGLILPLTGPYMPFDDDFSQTCSLAMASVDLLTNAGIMPIPMQLGNYGVGDGDSESNEAAHLMSLPVILRQSVIAPLTAQIGLVNKCILDYYIVELNIDKYFETLRSFLFLQDGEFSQSLCDQLFEKMAQGPRPTELFTPILLNQILSKAIQHSLNRESSHADNLSFSLKWMPHIFKPNAIDSLDCLELKFKVDWPQNIVITRSCLEKYNHVFSFMLQLKRASWVLRDIYFQLKRSALIHHAGNSTQFRQLQLFRHEMQHFVNVIQGYIANQVVIVSWEEFKKQLKSDVQNLDDLRNRHAEYLNKALFRCLLTKKAAPVMKIISDIFCLILKVRTQLLSCRWFYDPDIHQVVHPVFHTIRASYAGFKEYSGFLYKVVSKLVTRGYQPHLEEFLLRLNFNDFYSES